MSQWRNERAVNVRVGDITPAGRVDGKRVIRTPDKPLRVSLHVRGTWHARQHNELVSIQMRGKTK